MKFSRSKTFCTLLLAGIWWVSETDCYNVQRIDNGDSTNLEINFYSEIDRKKFMDDFQKAQNYRDSGNYQESDVTTTSSQNSLDSNDNTPLDSWSVVWYIASFGGLIIFFLIVSCSEWCCRRAAQRNNSSNNCNSPTPSPTTAPDTPPPSYDEFAPPSYESICLGRQGNEKSKYDIFVVPVHALGPMMEVRQQEEAPPSYLSTQTERPQFVPALRRLDSEVT